MGNTPLFRHISHSMATNQKPLGYDKINGW